MEAEELHRRAEIARRLKAARWLAGDVQKWPKGKTGYAVRALSPKDLAAREGMASNGFTASLLGAIERMERPTTPMERREIALGLRMPIDWFEVDKVAPADNDPAKRFANAARREAQRHGGHLGSDSEAPGGADAGGGSA